MSLSNLICIDVNKCLSIKKKNVFNVQCTYKKKGDSLVCGIHGRNPNPILVTSFPDIFNVTEYNTYLNNGVSKSIKKIKEKNQTTKTNSI